MRAMDWIMDRLGRVMQKDYIFLNRDNPFVDAVLRSTEDETALDIAATLLYEAENRYGIAFIDAQGIREEENSTMITAVMCYSLFLMKFLFSCQEMIVNV